MAEQGFQRWTLLTVCVQKLDGQTGANDDFYDCYGFAGPILGQRVDLSFGCDHLVVQFAIPQPCGVKKIHQMTWFSPRECIP